jgi:hypothetical protein
MFHKYAEISFQYVNSLLIILFSLNFILLTLLSRIARPGFKSTKANLTMVSINSFLRICIQLLKHSLVRGLYHIDGTNDWDIQPFGLSTLFYSSFNFQSPVLQAKGHQLPFSLSTTSICNPLELLYSDVWGPSPTLSLNGNRYYVSFIDAFSWFTWFIRFNLNLTLCLYFSNFKP